MVSPQPSLLKKDETKKRLIYLFFFFFIPLSTPSTWRRQCVIYLIIRESLTGHTATLCLFCWHRPSASSFSLKFFIIIIIIICFFLLLFFYGKIFFCSFQMGIIICMNECHSRIQGWIKNKIIIIRIEVTLVIEKNFIFIQKVFADCSGYGYKFMNSG